MSSISMIVLANLARRSSWSTLWRISRTPVGDSQRIPITITVKSALLQDRRPLGPRTSAKLIVGSRLRSSGIAVEQGSLGSFRGELRGSYGDGLRNPETLGNARACCRSAPAKTENPNLPHSQTSAILFLPRNLEVAAFWPLEKRLPSCLGWYIWAVRSSGFGVRTRARPGVTPPRPSGNAHVAGGRTNLGSFHRCEFRA
jgi:hypothetical protein